MTIPAGELFRRYVAIGDSLSHGMQCLCVDERRQAFSFPNQIHKAICASYPNEANIEKEFLQPLLKWPGCVINIEDLMKNEIGLTEFLSCAIMGIRTDNYANQAKLNNFGISGARINEIVFGAQGTLGFANPFFRLVTGELMAQFSNVPSEVDQALATNPSFVSVVVGNNDFLLSALALTDEAVTSDADFERGLNGLKLKLKAKMDEGTLKGGVISELPYMLGAIPYFKNPETYWWSKPFIPSGSKSAFWQDTVINAGQVLTKAELDKITATILRWNEKIRALGNELGFAVVNFDFLNTIAAAGGYYLKDGNGNQSAIKVTTDYCGGFFSLDGCHPSTTGYAVAGNEIIKGINAKYGTTIQRIDEVAVSKLDTLLQAPVDPREDFYLGIFMAWCMSRLFNMGGTAIGSLLSAFI